MKNDLPYFTHDNNARNHPKMKALRAQYGIAGYGLFWMLNEIISQAKGARLDLSRKINRASTAGELGMTLEQFDSFLAFLSDPEYDLVNYVDGIATTDRTQEDYSVVAAKRGRDKQNYQARNDSASGNADSASGNADSASGNDTEQSRAEQNREEFKAAGKQISTNPAREADGDESSCLPADIKIINTKIKAAPFPSSFSNTDLVAFALRIQKTGIDAGFVDYCIDRAAKGRKTEKPAGLLKRGLLEYDDWIEEYRKTPPPPGTASEYETLAPDIGICTCGQKPKVNRRLGEAVCSCGRSWTWDADWEMWGEDLAVADTG